MFEARVYRSAVDPQQLSAMFLLAWVPDLSHRAPPWETHVISSEADWALVRVSLPVLSKFFAFLFVSFCQKPITLLDATLEILLGLFWGAIYLHYWPIQELGCGLSARVVTAPDWSNTARRDSVSPFASWTFAHPKSPKVSRLFFLQLSVVYIALYAFGPAVEALVLLARRRMFLEKYLEASIRLACESKFVCVVFIFICQMLDQISCLLLDIVKCKWELYIR